MPQLSTGRKVAILLQRVADIIDNPLEHLDKLGQIDSVEQVCRFIPVVVFVESDGEREGHFELNQDSIRIHEIEGMRAVVQDYSVADVLNGDTDWSRQEVED
jgi:putative NADH-flavin reductase